MLPVVPVRLSVKNKLFPAEAAPLLGHCLSCYHIPDFICENSQQTFPAFLNFDEQLYSAAKTEKNV